MNYDTDTQQGGLIADLCAKLELHVGVVEGLTRELRRPKPRYVPAQPVFGRIRASGVVPSSGPLILNFDQPGPEQGFFWFVRSIVIGGLSPSITAMGAADVYVTAMLPNAAVTLAGLGLSDWRDHAATLPAVSTFYSRGSLPLRMNENLVVIITGGTAGQQYVAAAQFEQYQEGNVRESWSV